MCHLELLLHRYRNGLHQNLLLQPLPLLLLLMMMKMKVSCQFHSVSCQYTCTGKSTSESNKYLIHVNSLQMTSLLRRPKKRRSKQYKDRIPNQKGHSRRSHCHHQNLNVSTSTCTSTVRLQLLTGSLYKQVDLHLFPSLQDLFQVLQEWMTKISLMLRTQ